MLNRHWTRCSLLKKEQTIVEHSPQTQIVFFHITYLPMPYLLLSTGHQDMLVGKKYYFSLPEAKITNFDKVCYIVFSI